MANQEKEVEINTSSEVKDATSELAKQAVISQGNKLVKKGAEKVVDKVADKVIQKAAQSGTRAGAHLAALPEKEIPLVGDVFTATQTAADATNVVAQADKATKKGGNAQEKREAQEEMIESSLNVMATGAGASAGFAVGAAAVGSAGAGAGALEGGAVVGTSAGAVGTVVTSEIGGVEGLAVGGVGGGAVGAVGGGTLEGVAGAAIGGVEGAGIGASAAQTVSSFVSPIAAKVIAPVAAPAFEVAGDAREKVKETTGIDGVAVASQVANVAKPVLDTITNPMGEVLKHIPKPPMPDLPGMDKLPTDLQGIPKPPEGVNTLKGPGESNKGPTEKEKGFNVASVFDHNPPFIPQAAHAEKSTESLHSKASSAKDNLKETAAPKEPEAKASEAKTPKKSGF